MQTGIDLIEIDRIGAAIERWGTRFLNRIYTTEELTFSKGKYPQLAARFAAKEAVMKALETGRHGIDWKEIEVTRVRGRPPQIRLYGKAVARASQLHLKKIDLSLSHSRNYAIAVAIGETG